MQPLRAAVVGVGYFGSRHVEKLALLPNVRLEYVVDTDLDRAQTVAQKFGARPMTDLREIVSAIDVATVAVPTQAHAEVAETLLRSGVHVLIEKPLTATLDEADRVVAAAAAEDSCCA